MEQRTLIFNSLIIVHQYTMPALAISVGDSKTTHKRERSRGSKVSIARVCWFTYDNLSNGIEYRSCHSGLGVGGDKSVHSICHSVSVQPVY